MARDGRFAAARHLAYLERDGVERDGTPGQLYGAGESFDREAFAEPVAGEKRQFRFIVSPEDARDVDLKMFARELVAQMEEDLGRPLVWAAVNHHNTEHPHVHLVIRGVDADGKELRIPPRYIQQDMRARAQNILTRELGLRTEADIAEQRRQEVTQERMTSVDRMIATLLTPDGALDPQAIATLRGQMKPTVLARLRTLARLGLVSPGNNGAWTLRDGWQADLSQLGARNDIIKRLHRVVPADPTRYRFVEAAELTAPIEGVVRARGLHDELTGELFAAVENHVGEVHYVRLTAEAAEFVGDGDIVRIGRTSESWIKPTDRVLVAIAERNGGVYDPAAHLQQLEALNRSGTSPRDLVDGNLRRLERLERYGLATRRPDGAWLVPLDLLAQLQARETTHPRHTVLVQYLGAPLHLQARYAGPTWLDRQPPAEVTRGSSRFASELAAAARDRAVYLMSLGVDTRAPDKGKRLEATERMLFGRRRAAEVRASFDESPGTFRGKLASRPPLPSGRAFAEVLDEKTNRLVLVPWSGDLRRFEGRDVEVVVDQAKRAVVRPARRLSRGEE
jgi:type IV secretory pathway VirD2 relaxase